MNYVSSPWCSDLENTKKIKWWKTSSFVLQAKVKVRGSLSLRRLFQSYRGHNTDWTISLRNKHSHPTYESTLGKCSWVCLMQHNEGDLGSLTLIWIISKECTLRFSWFKKTVFFAKPCRDHGWEFRSSLTLFRRRSIHNCYVVYMTAVIIHAFKPTLYLIHIFLISNWYFMILNHRHVLRILRNLA